MSHHQAELLRFISISWQHHATAKQLQKRSLFCKMATRNMGMASQAPSYRVKFYINNSYFILTKCVDYMTSAWLKRYSPIRLLHIKNNLPVWLPPRLLMLTAAGEDRRPHDSRLVQKMTVAQRQAEAVHTEAARRTVGWPACQATSKWRQTSTSPSLFLPFICSLTIKWLLFDWACVHQEIRNCNVFLLTETWLNTNMLDSTRRTNTLLSGPLSWDWEKPAHTLMNVGDKLLPGQRPLLWNVKSTWQ